MSKIQLAHQKLISSVYAYEDYIRKPGELIRDWSIRVRGLKSEDSRRRVVFNAARTYVNLLKK